METWKESPSSTPHAFANQVSQQKTKIRFAGYEHLPVSFDNVGNAGCYKKYGDKTHHP